MRQTATLGRDSRALDVSLLGGFFCADKLKTGPNATVTTNNEPTLAHNIAEQGKEVCRAKRHAFHTGMVPVEEGVQAPIEAEDGLVVLGDWVYSGGTGTPGDGTVPLTELLKQNGQGAVVGNIIDPAACRKLPQTGLAKQ